MKIPNPEHVERLTRVINTAPYFKLISMKVCEIGAGHSLFEIDLGQKHLQPFGHVHGGVFATIIDTAASWAIFYGIEEHDAGMTSVDLKLNYLAPAVSGKLIAKGRQIKIGKTLGYAEAEVIDESGKILAHGTSTLMILPGKAPAAAPPLPSKFIE
ncbi:MAG: PaaI family thioesterase [Deltaproteobacteria bacterium]|nr:MAG: PaaI family thioesterase [Deltaproteobacteria bacterium]